MSIESRPYIGTWSLNGKELVQHTPDALIYINGDTALPGCPKCSGKIDIQQFVTECSVDAGTEPGSSSASFTLSVPLHHTAAFARDAKFLLKPGLEVHIYLRGYFPVAGLYEYLAEPQSESTLTGSDDLVATVAAATAVEASGEGDTFVVEGDAAALASQGIQDAYGVSPNLADSIVSTANNVGASPYMLANLINFESAGSFSPSVQNPDPGSSATGLIQFVESTADGLGTTTAELAQMSATEQMVWVERYLSQWEPQDTEQYLYMSVFYPAYRDADPRSSFSGSIQDGNPGITTIQSYIDHVNRKAKLDPNQDPTLASAESPGLDTSVAFEDTSGEDPEVQATYGPSVLEEMGLGNTGVEKALAYPYYHVFHGVVIEVGHSYSGGVNSISVNCSSMLHFWQYQNMSTNASVFGARPTNSKLKLSMVGHNFTGMHPYEIMYTLHYDTAGAAGGVGYALASKTNQTAVAEVGGESLYSLAIRYWEKRFQGRNIRLRMHGATGELFSTMAAAWLARTSSSNLTKLLRGRYSTPKGDGTMKVFSQASSVGLFNANRRSAIEATRVAASSKPGNEDNTPEFEINVLEMQAFVSNLGNWGQVNLFESSYESKLDVAQKVMGVTGFEFYQDVDGDFVFKPPMYNLDTSGSRVYRIEDIDIITISFSEKEPQVTYMTVKGSQFKNLAANGVENEWGVRGQYIDYRLVAQFGWRPGSYETAYFNDPKSMFFSAVNRMDILNIGINSCQVTIPERPEIRPGYPVYIPYLDCFYYCNSFTHSHSVGGQCTTSLQLVGKRAKFYAPGSKAGGGISDIDLGDTLLPQRPLTVIDAESGKPRLSGFPNVVMALDPTAINPLFFVIGTDVENIADPQVIQNLLEIGVQNSVLTEGTALEGGGKTYYMYSSIPGDTPGNAETILVRFYLNESDLTDFGTPSDAPGDTPGGDHAVETTTVNLLSAAVEYNKLQQTQAEALASDQETLLGIQAEITGVQAQISELQQQDREGNAAQIEALESKRTTLNEDRETVAATISARNESVEAEWRSPGGTQHGVAFLLEMLDLVGEKYRTNADFQGRTDLTSSINLLDMLSDKKAIFSDGTQPGMYRYYSASHPDKEHQGPKRAEYDSSDSSKVINTDEEPIETTPPTVWQYTTAVTAPFAGANIPEAALVEGQPTHGVRVLNSNPNEPDGEVLSTSEIMELMFSVQPVTAVKTVTSTFRRSVVGTLGKAVEKSFRSIFSIENAGIEPSPTDTLEEYFAEAWADLEDQYTTALRVTLTAAGDAGVPVGLSPPALTIPGSVTVWRASVQTDAKLNLYAYSGNEEEDPISLGPRGAKAPLGEFVNQAGSAIGASFYKQLTVARQNLDVTLKADGATGSQREEILSPFNSVMSTAAGAQVETSTRGTSKKDVFKQEKTFSPVFPVSDAKGYEVVGSYRYGRGVDIEPSGVFDQLHKYDVFSLLDKNLVDSILRVFVQGIQSTTVTEYTTVENADGTSKTVPVTAEVTGAAATQSLNEEALRQLRDRNLTDKQILDYGLAVMDPETGQLEFQLANYFADVSKDGVQKIPVINAAYSLADLSTEQDGGICDCKAAEAGVLLSAFGQSQYLTFTATPGSQALGEDPGDAGTRWVADTMVQASAAWEIQQQALRGEVLDRGGSNIVEQVATTLGIGDANPSLVDQALQASARAGAELKSATSQLSVDAANLKTTEGDDR